MRSILFILTLCIGFLVKGVAEESSAFRINLNPEKVSISENGIILQSDFWGELFLDNVAFDEQGLYTVCKIIFRCKNCHNEFEICPSLCKYCGTYAMETAGVGKNQKDSFADGILNLIFNDFSFYDGHLLLCGHGSIEGGASINDEGDTKIDFEIEYRNDDNSQRIGADVEIERNKDGDVSISGRITCKIDF